MLRYMFTDAIEKLRVFSNPCRLCPRNCLVKRREGQLGYCGIGFEPKVSSAGPHFGEEPVLVDTGGSGTIFFAGCNLRCVFCQNYDISQLRQGREISIEQLVKIMLSLQQQGCVNINLVSPSHVVYQAAGAIQIAREEGLNLPIVYNSGGYDSVETLKLLEDFVDIYMPDMKYADSSSAAKYSDAKDYPQINFAAVKEMHRQKGDLIIKNGLAVKGLLVRHLVLPNNLAGSKKIIDFLADEISASTFINIMAQYRPCYNASKYPELNQMPDYKYIDELRSYAASRGIRLSAD
jgi:putative pyruvate formate lyase activating enzyme